MNHDIKETLYTILVRGELGLSDQYMLVFTRGVEMVVWCGIDTCTAFIVSSRAGAVPPGYDVQIFHFAYLSPPSLCVPAINILRYLQTLKMSPRVFFITGTSTGFGAELVKVVLEKGDIAVATARDPSKLKFEGV